MNDSDTNFYAQRLPVGTRVTWTREVYRMPYAKRPTDTGVVVEHVGPRGDFLRVRADHDGSVVTGPAVTFRPVQS